jgi:hypothetical protein
MRRWAHSSQRSTCPPNAAVRQRSIADMTLSWPRLTWPAWEARQAGPRWRKMSATSTAGRDNGGVLGGWLHLVEQQVERTGHLTDRLDGDAGVKRRGVELGMPERTRAIMRTFYVIEIESSPERDSMLANDAVVSCHTWAGPLP